MAFQSLGFGVFLCLVFSLCWLLPERLRRYVLLGASIWFYMSWGSAFLLALGFAALVSYFAGIAIEAAQDPKRRKRLLTLSVCLILCPLLVFKYLNFFSASLCAALVPFGLRLHPVTLRLLQPVGISFYTFQTLGYVIDVYRGRIRAERDFPLYALFVCFFPHIVSGPIARAGDLIPQLKQPRRFDYAMASRGLRQLVWGFFKKMLIADHLAAYVDAAWADVTACSGGTLLLAALFFSLEIYCDFSGYSDIALGSARLLGIELRDNFLSPYLSESVRDFWGRWHVSLSAWFRDYVYIPLGGNRVSPARRDLNLMLTFLLSGLWHGADWSYLAWGGLHGLARVGEDRLGLSRRASRAAPVRLLRVLAVFLFTSAAWVFFRADSIHGALYVLAHLFSGISSPLAYLQAALAFLGEHLRVSKKVLLAALLLLTAYDWASLRGDVYAMLDRRPKLLRWGLYLAVGMLTMLFHYRGDVSFIYFQY